MENLSQTTIRNNTETCDVSWFKFYIIQLYIIPLISLIGFLTNFSCTIIFISIIKKLKSSHGAMHHYFLAKSITDLVIFVVTAMSPIFFCKSCSVSTHIIANIWFKFFYNFGEEAMILCSATFQIASLVDCYLSLSSSSNVCTVKTFKLLSVFTISLSLILSLVILFRFEIVKVNEPYSNSTKYIIEKTFLYESNIDKYLRFFQTVLRDYVTLVLMIICSLLIIVSMKNLMNKKKVLSGNASKLIKLKRKVVSALAISSLIYIIGHIPLCIYYLPFDKNSTFWSCYYSYSLVPFYSSYIFGFFIYLKYNKNFKACFFKLVSSVMFRFRK